MIQKLHNNRTFLILLPVKEANHGKKLLVAIIVKNTERFFAVVFTWAELEPSSVFRFLYARVIKSCKVIGKVLLVIISSEAAHGSEEFVQI